MNYAVLLAPDFALQAVRRADPGLAGRPVALIAGEGRKARIAEASAEAHEIAPGLAVTLAMARCPGLAIRARDPQAEAEAGRLLLAAAFTLSPRVEATAPGYCTVDLQGADDARTEARMQEGIAELSRSGLTMRIGAASTPLLARYAAQGAEPVRVVRDTAAFLAPLPLATAEATPAQIAVLHGWGIRTLGQLTALPKTEIGERLGTDGVRLWERAAGEATRVLRPTEPARTFGAEWSYEPPVEAIEPLLFRLRRHAERLALELRSASLVAEQLALTLLLEDETEYARTFRLPEPGANVEGWMRILQAHLDTVRTEARVKGVRLIARPARPPQKQDGLFDTGLRDPVLFWENLARVGALVGDDRVGTPVRCDTWQPDAVALEKPAEIVPAPADEPVHAPCGLTLRRFRPPWPAQIGFADDRPRTIAAAELHASVRATRGPFQLSGAWWKRAEAWAVEIWQVETDTGAIYQLARTSEGWVVEGVLD